MPWVRLDDGFSEHPKVAALSDAAHRLFIDALCYCARRLTDGLVLAVLLPTITRVRQPKRAATELVTAGLWEPTEGGWTIHDYLDFQPSSQKVRAERDKAKQRQALSRQRHSVTDTDVTQMSQRDIAVSHADVARAPTRPVPDPSSSSTPAGTRSDPPDPVDDDETTWIHDLAAELAQGRLDQQRQIGRTVTRPNAWLSKVAAEIETEMRAAARCVREERPGWSAGQVRAALEGRWGAVSALCGGCDDGWVMVHDGMSRCGECASLPAVGVVL